MKVAFTVPILCALLACTVAVRVEEQSTASALNTLGETSSHNSKFGGLFSWLWSSAPNDDSSTQVEEPDRHPVIVIPGVCSTALLMNGVERDFDWGANNTIRNQAKAWAAEKCGGLSYYESVLGGKSDSWKSYWLPDSLWGFLRLLKRNYMKCFLSFMKLYLVDKHGNNQFAPLANLQVRPDRGSHGTDGTKCLTKAFCGMSWVLSPVINTLTANGYTVGEDLFAIAYDWRMPPLKEAGYCLDFWKTVSKAVQNAKRAKRPHKVVIAAHSMGNIMTHHCLTSELPNEEWGEAGFNDLEDALSNIQHYMAISGPYGGSQAATQAVLSGRTFVPIALTERDHQAIAQNVGSLYWMIPQGPARGGEQRPRTLVHAAGTAEKLDASPITPPSPTAGIKRTNSMKFVDHADVDRDADRTVADAHHHRLERTGGDDSEEAVVCTRDNFGTAHGNRYDEECPVMVSILKEDGTSVNYRYGESEEMILDLFGEDSLEYEYFQHVKDVGYRGQNKLKRPEGIPITCIAGTGVKTASTLVYRADESTEIQRQVMSNSRRVNPFDLANLHNEDDDLFRISRHGLDNKNLKYLYTDGDGTVVTHSAMRLCDEHPGANTKKIEVAGNPGLHRDILDFETVKKEILAAATARTFTDVARAKIESADQDRSPVPGDLLPRGTHFG